MVVETTKLSIEEKYELIVRNLEEISYGDKIKALLKERDLKIYWGTVVAEKLDISYFVKVLKIADFLRAGCEVTILLADLHSYLDNKKSSLELLPSRIEYYENTIRLMLTSFDVPLVNLKFVKGTDFQLSKEYTLDVYKLSSLVTSVDAKEAGVEVIKQLEHPLLSALLYPSLQALDEQYLNVDINYGEINQKKIFKFAEQYLPALGYEKRIHLMSPTVQDLGGGKTVLVEDDARVGLLDLPPVIKSKLKKAFCEKGNVESNGLLSLLKHVLFPLLKPDEHFVITRNAAHGGNIIFVNYASVESVFAKKDLHPGDLKAGVEEFINKLLEPIRKTFEQQPQLMRNLALAYPGKKKTANVVASPASDAIIPSRLDMRIGKIVEVTKHPEADGLYVEKIDVGEGTPRTIVSGLVNHIPIEEMQDLLVLVLCNLKPAKLRGIESKGMLLCANVAEPKQIEAITPPAGTAPGEKVFVEGYQDGAPDEVLNPKKKVWDKLQVDLVTNGDCVCQWQGKNLLTASGGLLRCKTMKNAPVK